MLLSPIDMDDPYSVLAVARGAPESVVDAAYRALAKENHPDNGGDPENFKSIKQAYESIKSDTDPYQSKRQTPPDWFGSLFSVKSEPVETISVVGDPEGEMTVEGEIFTVRLLGILPDTDASEIVKLPDELGSDTRRTLVLFDIQNNTDDVQEWHRDNTQYIDTEGFTYEREPTTIDGDVLGPRWTYFSVELDAHARTYFVAMVEKMPPDAQLGKIVHRQSAYAEGRTSGWVEGQERYEFVIDEQSRTYIPLPNGD
jgi:hypothetical protein